MLIIRSDQIIIRYQLQRLSSDQNIIRYLCVVDLLARSVCRGHLGPVLVEERAQQGQRLGKALPAQATPEAASCHRRGMLIGCSWQQQHSDVLHESVTKSIDVLTRGGSGGQGVSMPWTKGRV